MSDLNSLFGDQTAAPTSQQVGAEPANISAVAPGIGDNPDNPNAPGNVMGMPNVATQGANNTAFASQGNNKNDAWSTSPDWRPQSPTGGLYGSFSDLAGGAQTPYEQWLGQQYYNTASNPMTGTDQQNLTFWNQARNSPFGAMGQNINNQWQNYTQSPGQAESGATQAYQNMIGSGYSPQEQAAIEGQGMRSLQNQRTASRDEMNRQQARTGQGAGYYGGISNLNYNYGQQLSDQARNNQITMANEKQRRTETGAGGLAGMSNVSNARQLSGLQGQTGQENTGFGRQLAATQGAQDISNQMFGRQQQGLQGAQGYSQYGRGLQQTGLQGLSSLYGQSDPTSTWNLAAQVASKPQETYNEFGTTNGGI